MNSSFTLLIVDDEKHNRTLLTELLQDDYQIILAKNGVQALKKARERSPDLILLDVMMPEMDGIQLIREARKVRPSLIPIVMTGFAFGDVLAKVAPDFPDTKFAIIDMVVEQPNVKSVVFNEHEGSYLVGMMAALASKTGTVGFIGGMDIPLIRKFGCGYAQGVLAAIPKS